MKKLFFTLEKKKMKFHIAKAGHQNAFPNPKWFPIKNFWQSLFIKPFGMAPSLLLVPFAISKRRVTDHRFICMYMYVKGRGIEKRERGNSNAEWKLLHAVKRTKSEISDWRYRAYNKYRGMLMLLCSYAYAPGIWYIGKWVAGFLRN